MIKTKGIMADKVMIKGAFLWDGKNREILPEGAVLVEGEYIKAAGTVSEIRGMNPDRLIDWTGTTLMPGMIDSHTHLSMDATLDNYLDHMTDSVAELTLRATAMMRKDLLSGVTTCRCLGDREFLDIACREAVKNGLVTGPELLVATRGIRAPNGHGFVGYPFDGEDQIRQAIRENAEMGANLIKIYISGTLKGDGRLPSFLSYEEIRAAIDEAHQQGLKIASHCVGGEGLDWALELGLDTLEHAYHISDGQIEKLKGSDTWLVLTPSPMLTKERIENLPERLIPGHLKEGDEVAGRMAAMIQAGIPFALGTDGMHGELAQEAVYVKELGASNYDALRGVTNNGAVVCEIAGKTGSLEAGKYADIIALDGNPLKDINALKRIAAVMKHGVIHSGYHTHDLQRTEQR